MRTSVDISLREDVAEQTLRTIISWGRYAELYDDNRQAVSLENPA